MSSSSGAVHCSTGKSTPFRTKVQWYFSPTPKSETTSQVPTPNPPLFRLSYPSAVMNGQFIRHANLSACFQLSPAAAVPRSPLTQRSAALSPLAPTQARAFCFPVDNLLLLANEYHTDVLIANQKLNEE